IAEIIAFRDRGEHPCGHVRVLLRRQVGDLDRRIKEMRRLRDELRRLEAQAGQLGATEGTYCGLIEHIGLKNRAPEPAGGDGG
ncbi:MAG: MerR family DNA-binding protein, partial [Acidimicrobiales bacterium]